MASYIYTSTDGQMIDEIVYKYYGNLNGTLEAVLLANPELSKETIPLPAGVKIYLPEVQKQSKQINKLW
jgi:phage tail protein X